MQLETTKVPGVLIDRTNKLYVLVMSNKDRVDALKAAIPFLAVQPVQDKWLVALPLVEDSIRLLENQGLPTRSLEPLNYLYTPPLIEGKYKPMASQLDTAAFAAAHNRCYITSTMRCGKTGAMIMCADYLQSVRHVKGAVLIVATVSNLTGVWAKSIQKTLPHKRVVVLHGGVGKKDRLAKLKTPADYYIINYDGVKMLKDELRSLVEQGSINIVIIDELTHYGNMSSGRYAAMNSIVNGKTLCPYVYGLTGSPGDNPIPIFGFCKLINASKLPCRHITTWRDITQYKYGRERWQWRNKADCKDTIFSVMQPNIRYDKKDIMDLPPVVKQIRDCELSAEQWSAYKTMQADMVSMLESEETIEAVHKASLSQKLFQIALGTAITSNGGLIDLDNKSRVDVIEEVIKEASQKVVIFCAYTGVIDRLHRQLTQRKYTVAIVDGRVTGNKRTQIFDDFQNKPNPYILICHPQTTAFGVELAAADTMIFNGPPLSGGFIYEQALERLSSLKQKAQQIAIVQIAATDEERQFFNGLDNGVKASELINDMFARLTRQK